MSDPPSSNRNFHFPTRTLSIYSLKGLDDIIESLKSTPDFKQTNKINILENEAIEDEYDDKYGEERFLTKAEREERDSKLSLQISHNMGAILDIIQAENGLKEFTWENLFHKPRDSQVFWDALWRSSKSLEKLNLVFNPHELHRIAELSGPTEKFAVLKTLCVDARGAHGDNGAFLSKLLRACPAIEELTLSFPNCDLEDCRIRNITWDFTFPSLKSFTFHGYGPDEVTFSSFLARHPGIKTLV
ncbi:hypothetical protein HYFRA_00003037 [Hymenoscyphus fraxineus]|uniref:Uncharacterized protein n=1 Tax=Hymenoscyphus fraxineus TaxID=746836 RepID=A0A9N9KPM7_9HELO|nr:hypothetical protein HYFRA_00003037 [Hymenoscyphus fraxineus]